MIRRMLPIRIRHSPITVGLCQVRLPDTLEDEVVENPAAGGSVTQQSDSAGFDSIAQQKDFVDVIHRGFHAAALSLQGG